MHPTTRRRAAWALVALAVGAFTYVTAEVLPIGLLTVIAADLDRSPSETGLLVTGYAVVVVLASLPLTRLTQRVPRRRVLTVTLAVFVAGMLLTAVAPNYPTLLAARLLVAATQALFWAVAAPAAAAMFPPEFRGRAIARMSIGSALGPVLGVPTGTWVGQQVGWRAAFALAAAVGLVTCVTLAALLPGRGQVGADRREAGRGTTPDARRFALLIVVTFVGVGGHLTAYTYITPFLLEFGGFSPAALSPLLLAAGISGVAGTILIGRVVDSRPRTALIGPLALITCALLVLYALGALQPVAVVAVCVTGMSFSALAAAIGGRSLQVAPGSTDIATAIVGVAFNTGIAGGSLLGGALIDHTGVRSVTVAGALLTATALAALLCERWVASARRTAPERTAPTRSGC
ncbi:MFS transporter [Microbispora rosea subsp. aerata]|nr:MFS transporter [Microbispora rosea]GGO08563.1 MFS transporter [Microbispora rosea subsp. aerata]GIH55379.1 MFS transporter [Microbispora rosea subsp. aerata]GLJ84576.1 MFS transporter [Microbispora rosea subsp. aerata]